MCKKNVSYFIFKCNGVKCTIVSTESTSKWYECGAWVNPSSYFLPLFNNSAIGQWGGGIVPLGACGERVAAFIWPENEEEEMGGSGRNLESCLQISLRTRKASSEHLWTESPRSPSLFLLDLPVLFFLQRISISSQHLEYTKRVRIYANPTRESTTFVKLKRRNVSFLCETNISDPSNRHLTR